MEEKIFISLTHQELEDLIAAAVKKALGPPPPKWEGVSLRDALLALKTNYMSVRLFNSLKHNMESIDIPLLDFSRKYNADRLLSFRCLGNGSLKEIEKMLASYDIKPQF